LWDTFDEVKEESEEDDAALCDTTRRATTEAKAETKKAPAEVACLFFG
jgi:hypothetical protein